MDFRSAHCLTPSAWLSTDCFCHWDPFWFYCLFFLKCNMEMESSTFFFFQSLHDYLRSTKLVLTCQDAASHTLRGQAGPNLLMLQGFNSRHSLILKQESRDLKKMGKRQEEMRTLGRGEALQLCWTKGKSFPGSACSTFHAVCAVECRSRWMKLPEPYWNFPVKIPY